MKTNNNQKNKFKIFRKKIGLTRADLSRKLNCTWSSVQKWELGKSNPSFLNCKKLIKISKNLGFDFSYDDLRDD